MTFSPRDTSPSTCLSRWQQLSSWILRPFAPLHFKALIPQLDSEAFFFVCFGYTYLTRLVIIEEESLFSQGILSRMRLFSLARLAGARSCPSVLVSWLLKLHSELILSLISLHSHDCPPVHPSQVKGGEQMSMRLARESHASFHCTFAGAYECKLIPNTSRHIRSL
ncbi:hypothetical protein BGZ61DRAFT_136447 [Ilyonectria robusta]|uniref:uncharacterized protein n=1 Tax=Ilyonectria robusta TaxID=1079257 RepID=UPI001E8D586A|nr:uncharacterized protein BGZ61DRAFT_136447 [Ilyonectria robusta]KAH8735175.1 hypothetical protein BGZ61DRAFT_136447 [Ilyonectria robusta]